MEKVFYDNKPATLTKVGDGSYRYAWDIQPITIESADSDSIEQYTAYEVFVWSPVTANKITEAVINAMWPMGYEQKLVNEYNSAVLGLLPTDEADVKIKAYKDFLRDRAMLKAQVDKDCAELNIR